MKYGPPKVKAVVFDLYNTLIRIDNPKHPYINLFSSMELGHSDYAFAINYVMTNSTRTLCDVVDKLGNFPELKLDDYEKLIKEELDSIVMFGCVPYVLGRLKKQGFSLGLISNVSSPYTAPFFEFGLDNFFDSVIFSCSAGLKKPDPAIYTSMSQSLSVPIDEMVMVGDSYMDDVQGPLKVGMKAIHLSRSGKTTYKPSVSELTEVESLLPKI